MAPCKHHKLFVLCLLCARDKLLSLVNSQCQLRVGCPVNPNPFSKSFHSFSQTKHGVVATFFIQMQSKFLMALSDISALFFAETNSKNIL